MQFSKSQKKCATCVYWSGERELHENRRYVIADPNERGACQHPKSTSAHIENMGAVFHCDRHETWDAIR